MTDSYTNYTHILYFIFLQDFFIIIFDEISEIPIIKSITNVCNYKEIVEFRSQLKSFIR